MSELAKTARKAMRAKVKSLVKGHSGPVDASGYEVPDELDADIKTGMRPISRRQFKRGGKVVAAEGDKARKNAGKKPRKAAGGALATPNNLINRDDREANKERSGKKHIGGFASGGAASSCDDRDYDDRETGMKRGGRAKKMDGGYAGRGFSPSGTRMAQSVGLKKGGRSTRDNGGPVVLDKPRSGGQTIDTTSQRYRDAAARAAAASGNASSQSPDYRRRLGSDKDIVERGNRTPYEPIPRKSGGKAEAWEGSKKDEAQDRKLAKKYGMSMSEWERSAKDKKHDSQKSMKGLKKGGRAGRDAGGAAPAAPAAAVAGKGGSGLLGGFKKVAPYLLAGVLGSKIFKEEGGEVAGKKRTARKHGGTALDGEIQGTRPTGGRLARKSGGRAKGKVNVNIVIATKGPQDGMTPPAGIPARPQGVPIPVSTPPAGGGLGAGAPPAALPMAAGAAPMPPMGRKRGGRVYRSYKDMDAGSGSGEGRLEKTEIQKHKK